MSAASDDEYDLNYKKEEEEAQEQLHAPNWAPASSAHADAFSLVGNPNTQLPPNLLAFAGKCCDEFGLADMLKDDVLQTAALPPQFLLVRVYARTVAFEKHVQASKVASFLQSREFKETLTRRVQAGLLDPNIPHYVNGTTTRFIQHMIENPASYEIPPAAQAQLIHSRAFSSAIGRILSSFRGEIQRKLQKSVAGSEDIITLATKLAIHGFQINQDHLNQMAFLRMYYVEFKDSNKANDDKNTNRFWAFIDKKLDKLRKKSLADRLVALQRNFAKDKRAFPPPKSGGPQLDLAAVFPEWQASVAHSIITMAGYRVGSSPTEEPSGGGQTSESRRRMRDTRSTQGQPPGTRPINPIHRPKSEEKPGEEDVPEGNGLAQQPTSAHLGTSKGLNMDSPMESARDYGQPPLGNGAPNHRGGTPTRRGASHTITTLGANVRHNPLTTAGRPSTPIQMTPGQLANSRGWLRPTNGMDMVQSTGSAGFQANIGSSQQLDGTQYDSQTSETAASTMGY